MGYGSSKVWVKTTLYTDSTDGTDHFRFLRRNRVIRVFRVQKEVFDCCNQQGRSGSCKSEELFCCFTFPKIGPAARVGNNGAKHFESIVVFHADVVPDSGCFGWGNV